MYLFNCPLQEGKGKVKNADLAELFWFSHWTAVAVLFPSLPQPTPSAIAVNTRSPQPWASTAQGEVASRARKSLCTFFPSWVPLFARSPQWDSLPISQLTSYFQLGMQFPWPFSLWPAENGNIKFGWPGVMGYRQAWSVQTQGVGKDLGGRKSKTKERQTGTASDGSPHPGGTTAITAVGLTIHSWLAAGDWWSRYWRTWEEWGSLLESPGLPLVEEGSLSDLPWLPFKVQLGRSC